MLHQIRSQEATLHRRSQLCFVAGALGILLSLQQSLLAGGTLSTCDEAGLRAALVGGGTVTFACDGTITLTNTLIITNNTTLDASGRNVTISGGNAVRLFNVNTGVLASFVNLTLADGFATGSIGNPGFGGAISNGGGQVSLVNCSLLRNVAQGGPSASGFENLAGSAFGGAIYCSTGSIWASNTLFSANSAKGGQGLGSGTSGNAYGGALFQNGGVSIFGDCRFENNNVTSPTPIVGIVEFAPSGAVQGGAVFHSNGVWIATNCNFVTNTAAGGSSYRVALPGAGRGGAVFSSSELTIRGCRFLGNMAIGGKNGDGANGEGGALYLTQPTVISASEFVGNSVRAGKGYTGGVFAQPGGTAYGGSIYSLAMLTLTDSTLALNKAEGAAGFADNSATAGTAAYGGGLYNAGLVLATNVTFHENLAVGGSHPFTNQPPQSTYAGGNALGGGLCNIGGTVQFVHATFSGNSAVGGLGSPNGQSLGGGIQNSNGTVTVAGSIVANSTSGSNCFGTLTDGGYNLSSDSSAGFSATGSLNNTDPVLGPLDDFGGPTLTMPLLSGSPAIDGGNNTTSPPTDQRGHTRPYGSASDIGAFESSPPYTVVGNITGNTLVDEVTVVANPYITTTFDHGHYNLQGLPDGGHTVTPAHSNYVFFPTSRSVTVGPDTVNVDFKAYRLHALSIEGVSGNVIQLMYAGTNGHSVELMWSSNLFDWSAISTNTIGSSNLLEISIPISTATPKRFFRTLEN